MYFFCIYDITYMRIVKSAYTAIQNTIKRCCFCSETVGWDLCPAGHFAQDIQNTLAIMQEVPLLITLSSDEIFSKEENLNGSFSPYIG